MEVEAVARAFAPIQTRDPARIESPSRSEDAPARVRGDAGRSGGVEAFGGIALELSARAVSASANAVADPDAARRAAAADEAIVGRPPAASDDEFRAGGLIGGEEDAAAESGAERAGAEQPGELTKDEQEEVQRLRARDVEVRTHESAHKAAAGRHARGGPSYEFERGPDGRRYAVGGEVSIDTSAVANDPDATILKMQQVRRAALAPAEPSSQDRKVASEASRTEAQARADKREAQQSESADVGSTTEGSPGARFGEAQERGVRTGEAGADAQAENTARSGSVGRTRGQGFATSFENRRGRGLDLSA